MGSNAGNVGLAALLIGISVFLIMYAIYAPRKSAGTLGRTPTATEANDGFSRYVRPMLRNFIPQTPLAAAAQNSGTDKIELLLIRSGNPWNIRPEEFLGIQALFAAIGLFGGILMAAFNPLESVPGIVWLLAFPFAGYLLPYSYHNTLKENRSKEVQKQLPEMLDLLVITLASGQNFEPALGQVAPTLPTGLLKEEITKVNYELAAGRGIEASLLDFARRASSDEVESFAKAVSQAQRLGSDVSETLVNQATSARAAYESRIEKKISRLSSIMMVPLVFTMIPSLMLIIIAPTMSQLTSGMGM